MGMKPRKEDSSAIIKRVLRPVVIGTVIGAGGCLLILLLMAAVMASSDIPKAAVTPMAVAAAAIGAFISGIVAARISREKGLMLGAVCGLLLYLLVMLAGFAVLREIRGAYAVVKLAVMIGCAALGGVLGVNMGKR